MSTREHRHRRACRVRRRQQDVRRRRPRPAGQRPTVRPASLERSPRRFEAKRYRRAGEDGWLLPPSVGSGVGAAPRSRRRGFRPRCDGRAGAAWRGARRIGRQPRVRRSGIDHAHGLRHDLPSRLDERAHRCCLCNVARRRQHGSPRRPGRRPLAGAGEHPRARRASCGPGRHRRGAPLDHRSGSVDLHDRHRHGPGRARNGCRSRTRSQASVNFRQTNGSADSVRSRWSTNPANVGSITPPARSPGY